MATNPRQVDPNVHIPTAVRAAAEAADQKLRELASPNDPPPSDPPPAEPPAPEPPPPLSEPAPLQSAEPLPPPAEPPPPEAAPDARTREQVVSDHKAEVGKNRALRARVRELEDEATNLRSVLASMSAAAPVQPSAAELPAELMFEDFSDTEVQELGPEFVAAAKRAAGLLMAPHIKALQDKHAELDARLGQTTQSIVGNAQERMRGYLADQVPDWQLINADEKFKDWVQNVDDLSGQKFQDMLLDAWNRNDGPRVAVFFKRFREASGAPQSVSGPAPGNPAQPAPAKPPLERFAAPGTARPGSGTPATPAYQAPITPAAIARFYADVNAGRFKGREAEKDAMEKRIFEATGGGTVVA